MALFYTTFMVLKSLLKWKEDYSTQLEGWMNVIGEFEMLDSLANLAHNNPGFVFPEINSEYKIGFADLGHPLLNPATRVGNDTHFLSPIVPDFDGFEYVGKKHFSKKFGHQHCFGRHRFGGLCFSSDDSSFARAGFDAIVGFLVRQ